MALAKLSDDLLLQIVSWVGTDIYEPGMENIIRRHGSKLLAPLALCSRRLNTIASPLLYRTLVQTEYGRRTLPIFLRLILEKPEIRSEVKVFRAFEFTEDDPLDMSMYLDEDFERCRLAIDSICDHPFDEESWLLDITNGNWDAIVSLLFFLLPRLEEINMMSYHGESEYIRQTLEHTALQQSVRRRKNCLKHVRKVKLAHHDTEMGMSIDDVKPYCALPSVEEVHFDMLGEEEDFEPYSFHSNVQDMYINNGAIDGDAIVSFLRCFPSLRVFRYINGGANIGFAEFQPHKFGEAIAHLHGCLEKFELIDGACEDIYELTTIGTLARFTKLKNVFVFSGGLFREGGGEDGDNALQLVDILPASIEELRICDFKPSIFIQLRELLANKQQRFSLLKLCVMDDWKRNKEIVSGNWKEALRNDFKEASVRLVIS